MSETFDSLWRQSLRSRKRENTSEEPRAPTFSVDGIGEFSSSELLFTFDQPGSSSTQFLLTTSSPDESFRLFWVGPQGTLHHGYSIGTCHLEHTHSGHSFALFRGETLVFSYRLLASLGPNQIHHVHLGDASNVSATIRPMLSEARVIAEFGQCPFLPANKEWEVVYSFSVPPLVPKMEDYNFQTVYVWGDLSFGMFCFVFF